MVLVSPTTPRASVATATAYRDKPDYEFLVSLLQLAMDGQAASHIPKQRHLPDQAREAACETLLRGETDFILFMDDDQEFPRGFVERLLSRNKLIVAGLYFLKKPPYTPLVYDWVGLLLDWQQIGDNSILRVHLKDGTYQFATYDGLKWQGIGKAYRSRPAWGRLPKTAIREAQGLLETARLSSADAIDEFEMAIEQNLEWLRSLGSYTAHLYMPRWGDVGRFLAANSDDQYLRPGPVLLPDREGALIEVDAAGTGCMMIHRSVLEKVPRPWFSYREGGTEDMYFCRKAKRAGFKVYADMSVVAAHSGTNHVHFLRAHAKNIEEHLRDGAGSGS